MLTTVVAETAGQTDHVTGEHTPAEVTEHSKQLLRSHAVLGPWLRLLECVMGGGNDCTFDAS
jgi:hypothetical protein